MPSISRVLSAFAFGLLVASAPAVATNVDLDGNASGSENAQSVPFLAGAEILTYNGDGSSANFPLVSLMIDTPTLASGDDGIPFAVINGATVKSFLPFAAAKLSSGAAFLDTTTIGKTRNHCVLGGEVGQSWTSLQYKISSLPGAALKTATYNKDAEMVIVPKNAVQICLSGASSCVAITDPIAAYQQLTSNKVYKFNCGSDGKTPLYVRFQYVKTTSAPIAGMLDWVSNAPAAPADYNNGVGSTVAPTQVQIPFLKHLEISAGAYVYSGQVVNAQEPNYFAQVPLDSLSGANSQDAANLANGIVSFQIANNLGTATITDIVGCFIQNADKTWKTVNDNTLWDVPTSPDSPVNDFYPQCYFVATNGGATPGTSTNPQDVFTAKVQVHLRVLAPCVKPSAHTYVFADVEASFRDDGSTDDSDPVIYDNFQSKPGGIDNQVIATTHDAVLNLASGKQDGSWPFYSFYQASDNRKLMNDPIGAYLASLSPPLATLNADGSYTATDKTMAADLGHPILCREVQKSVKKDKSGNPVYLNGALQYTYTPMTKAAVLVNDRTAFTPGDYIIKCIAWDESGNESNVATFTLTVNAAPVTPPEGGGDCDSPNPAPGACGDPQFTGFLGQSFQVHGVSGQVYNVLSTPHFQYNALFTYLSEGKCRKGTQCFSHPGNYFGQVGLLFRSASGKLTKVQVIAGAVDAGLTVLVDEVAMEVSAASRVQVGEVTLKLATPFELVVEAPEFSMQLANSDMFINQNVAINTPLLRAIQQFKRATKNNEAQAAAELEAALPHGLLGQTWQHKTYANRWKYIEGTLFEYAVADGLLGADFKYNRF